MRRPKNSSKNGSDSNGPRDARDTSWFDEMLTTLAVAFSATSAMSPSTGSAGPASAGWMSSMAGETASAAASAAPMASALEVFMFVPTGEVSYLFPGVGGVPDPAGLAGSAGLTGA